MEVVIADEFGYEGQSVEQFRRKLAARAEQMLVRVTESKLKAFTFRLFDQTASESEWLNSMGSVLVLRPSDKWRDEDEETFYRELESSAGRFRRAEGLAFSKGAKGEAVNGLRVAITQANGLERQQVIHFEAEEEKLLNQLQQQISSIIQKNNRLGIAAASKAIWSQLKTEEEAK